jgi:signal transduction histidine kinase
VLTIHSGAEFFPTNPILDAAIREALLSGSEAPIDYYAEYLEADRFGAEAAPALGEYLRLKYRSRHIDLVIAITDEALRFLLDRREQLFPHAPIVFAALDVPDAATRGAGSGLAALRVGSAYQQTLSLALDLHPATEDVFVVATSPHRPSGDAVRIALQGFSQRVQLTFIDEATLPGVLAVLGGLPPRSLVLHIWHTGPGNDVDPTQVASLVAQAAPVPVYGTVDLNIGTGIVGGVVRGVRETGTRLGQIALQVLRGTRAEDVPVEDAPLAAVFDWRQLQRWGISESRLPPGSEIRFRGPSLWRDHRREVLLVLSALVLQSLLIVALLYQRGARQRAEVQSRRNLALAADANRRVTMTALTGSIAHELGQPLNGIMHNAQAGEMLIASQRATPEKLREILADIRTADLRATQIVERHRTMLRSRELDTKSIDIHAVVREGIALIAADARSKRVQIDIRLPPDPCFVVGDPVLLQQVVVNLVMNAMDAMTETPPDRRRITVRSTVTGGEVEVSVRDEGTGLPASFEGKLFEPFVTTKTNGIGIGLTIARTIIEAHRGGIAARSNPDTGATITVSLPCAETPVIP